MHGFILRVQSKKHPPMKAWILALCFLPVVMATAQEAEFRVELSHDTLLLGNYVELRFTIENVQGKFSPPDLSGFKLLTGPNQASSYSIINGQVKQSSSYTYFIEPEAEGSYVIGPATLKTGNREMHTPEVTLIVRSNPDQLIQNPGGRLKYQDQDLRLRKAPAQQNRKKTYRL